MEWLDKYKTHVAPEQFLDDARNIKFSDATYYISYPEFIDYFKGIGTITKHNLIIGINFTYGWMPTILNFKSIDLAKPLEIVNKAKRGIIPTIAELTVLKKTFNNSLVGPSKLLHFINPENFAILDSRVWYYITKTGIPTDENKICPAYLDYLKFCEYLTEQIGFADIQKSIQKKIEIKYEMTKFRAAELVMYTKGEKPKKPKK